MTETEIQAVKDAADLLDTEASSLSFYMMKMKIEVDREGFVLASPESIPHRVGISIATEMRRLRRLRDTLRGLANPT